MGYFVLDELFLLFFVYFLLKEKNSFLFVEESGIAFYYGLGEARSIIGIEDGIVYFRLGAEQFSFLGLVFV